MSGLPNPVLQGDRTDSTVDAIIIFVISILGAVVIGGLLTFVSLAIFNAVR